MRLRRPFARGLFVQGLCAQAVLLIASAPCQSLIRSTTNAPGLRPTEIRAGAFGSRSLPTGSLTLPAELLLSTWLGPVRLRWTGTPTSVAVAADAVSTNSFSLTSCTYSDLVTRVATALPARIELRVQAAVTYVQQLGITAVPGYEIALDLGDDGNAEFRSTALQPTTTATLTAWCDDLGTDVRWQQLLDCPYATGGLGGTLTAMADLTLTFADPVQEAAYGPSCAGKLGCQLGAGPFDRVFVASLPGDVVHAWLMGGDTRWNLQFQGLPCPLLVEPQFILAVPTFAGPNGRRYADLDATFPPLPGLTFYAQAIAISNGTFVGTNGVIVRT